VYDDCTAWTGGNDISIEGDYRWQSSDSKMEFTNWHGSQPSVWHEYKQEDCVELMRNGEWNDLNCNAQNTFICEKGI
jgi:hypothetical protein